MHRRLPVAGEERFILITACKQGLEPFDFKLHFHAALQSFYQTVDWKRLAALLHGSAQCGEQMGVFRIDDLVFGQLQRSDKRRFQLGQIVKRSSEKRDAAANRLAAGKPGDRLVDDRLKDRRGEICFRHALVDQRLNVGLGKHAAACGDSVDLLIIFCRLVQPFGVGLQKRRHLVDERSGASGADAVHPLVKTALEIYDLGVLAAELDGDVGLRIIFHYGVRHGNDLLRKGDAQRL